MFILQPKLEEYMEGKCGTKSDFWKQGYVEKLVKEAQEAKSNREDVAEQLGVTVDTLVKHIEKLNKQDDLSEYERLRQENIAERMQLFKQLGFQGWNYLFLFDRESASKAVLKARKKLFFLFLLRHLLKLA